MQISYFYQCSYLKERTMLSFPRAPCEPAHPFATMWRLQPWTEAVYGTIYRFSLRHLAHVCRLIQRMSMLYTTM